VQLDTGQVLLKHGAVAGYMDAMTMPFQVADRASILQRRPGDLVTATLVVGETQAYLSTLTKTGHEDVVEPPPPPPLADVLTPGQPVKDATLVDQDGKPRTFSSFKGHRLAVTFIYTRCPLPDVCPLLDKRFSQVQKAAAADDALRGRIRLLSVSFDPDTDTPAVLTAHAARLGADVATWKFVTAPREVVDRFSAQFGVNVIREADGSITHSMRTVVVGRDGRITAARAGMQWTPEELLADLRAAVAAQ
jgi:protein SCO1/2